MKRYHADVVIALLVGAIAVAMLAKGYRFPAGGNIFPIFSTVGIVAFAAVMIGNALLVRTPRSREWIVVSLDYDAAKPWLVLLLVVGYIPAMSWLGYYASTLVFLIAASLLVGVRRFRTLGLTALILLPSMYAFFELFLRARLPRGVLL